jgi:L-amino acid N-acyltransferase YncA
MLPLEGRRCLNGMLNRIRKLDRLPANGRRTLVAEEAGEVVGFAELKGDRHLEMFYVRADAVGSGVGWRLYRPILSRCV